MTGGRENTAKPIFVIRLRARAGVDPIKALRALLKRLKRHDALQCIEVRQIDSAGEK